MSKPDLQSGISPKMLCFKSIFGNTTKLAWQAGVPHRFNDRLLPGRQIRLPLKPQPSNLNPFSPLDLDDSR
jgi:hypothetical protein